MRLFTIFALVFPLACAAAEPAVRIEGQIYISRADGETVKLSSVTVLIVSTKAVTQMQAQLLRIKALEEDNLDMRRRSWRLNDSLPKLKAEQAAQARKAMEELRTQTLKNIKEIDELRLASLRDPKHNILRFFDAFCDARWPVERTVQTDPDGKFTAEVPAGEWSVVACASRLVVDDSEKYLWMTEAKDGERLMLNNSNLYRRR